MFSLYQMCLCLYITLPDVSLEDMTWPQKWNSPSTVYSVVYTIVLVLPFPHAIGSIEAPEQCTVYVPRAYTLSGHPPPPSIPALSIHSSSGSGVCDPTIHLPFLVYQSGLVFWFPSLCCRLILWSSAFSFFLGLSRLSVLFFPLRRNSKSGRKSNNPVCPPHPCDLP
jgi:hypothetical protein